MDHRVLQASTGQRIWIGDNFRKLTRRDDLAAARPGLRSKVDDVVGAAHCFFVMLDDNE